MKKIFYIIILVIGIIATSQIIGLAQTEATIRDETIVKLRQIYSGQLAVVNNYEGHFYPIPHGWDEPEPACDPSNICWQGKVLSSLNNANSSNNDLINLLGAQNDYFCPQDLTINVGPLGGDVRFRCRRQGAGHEDLWCFAYRCEQASPAGCKQKWRLRFLCNATT